MDIGPTHGAELRGAIMHLGRGCQRSTLHMNLRSVLVCSVVLCAACNLGPAARSPTEVGAEEPDASVPDASVPDMPCITIRIRNEGSCTTKLLSTTKDVIPTSVFVQQDEQEGLARQPCACGRSCPGNNYPDVYLIHAGAVENLVWCGNAYNAGTYPACKLTFSSGPVTVRVRHYPYADPHGTKVPGPYAEAVRTFNYPAEDVVEVVLRPPSDLTPSGEHIGCP